MARFRDTPLKGETVAAEALGWIAEPFKDVIPPIHMATTFERAADGSYPGGKKYARDESPAYDQAEAVLTALEGGQAAMLFSSGIAAATSVFLALSPGDTILAPKIMYWALRKWLLGPGREWGIHVEFYENGDLENLESLIKRLRPRLIWIETPANPTWDVQDIAATAELCRRYGCYSVADSTVATPVLTRPLHLGVDLVMHSATKYLNGHSDVVAGALVTRSCDSLWERIRRVRAYGGAILGPMESWLLLRGMRTLFLRVPRAVATAERIAKHFCSHKSLLSVLHPSLRSHPGHDVATRQMDGGFGAMVSFRFKEGESEARRFISRLSLFRQATSLGSVESLVEHRASVEGEGTLCPNDLVRLSVGIENPEDLISDLEYAL